MFTCTLVYTCLDFSLHTTVCKHIRIEASSKQSVTENEVASDLKYLLTSDGWPANKDVLSLRKEVFTLVNQLYAAVNVCADEDALHAAKQHTKAAMYSDGCNSLTSLSTQPT